MRIDGQTYDIAGGHNVKYVDMTPDGTKVYFTSTEDLTEDASDPDTSRDLYMWSEESPAPNHLTLVSKGNEPFAGNTDACSASWTEQVRHRDRSNSPKNYSILQGGIGGGPYSDNTIAPDNGDIYFLSPERLAGNNGVDGQENLFVYHGGKLQFVAALDPERRRLPRTAILVLLQRHGRRPAADDAERRVHGVRHRQQGHRLRQPGSRRDVPLHARQRRTDLRLLQAQRQTADRRGDRQPQRPLHEPTTAAPSSKPTTRWSRRTPTKAATSTSTSTAARS